jgi:SPP1 family holin
MNNLNNKISAGTIARTAVLALALINQLLSALGKPVLPIENGTLEQLISTGFTTVSALVNWWYNNSFTPEAIEADAFMARMKKRVR